MRTGYFIGTVLTFTLNCQILKTHTIGRVDIHRHSADLATTFDDGYISHIGDVEHEAL
jgi:hypothetical protein